MDNRFMLTLKMPLTDLAVAEITNCNAVTSRFGLTLTPAQAKDLVETRAQALSAYGRFEFKGGAIQKIIMAFQDSPFILSGNYAETLCDLIDTFYFYKNETLDKLSDDELIGLMKQYYNTSCQGSLELLQVRELEALARNIRAGLGCYLDDIDNLLVEED